MARTDRSEGRGRDREYRRTDNNLISEILALKPIAFGSGADKIDLIDWLKDVADNVRSGQKRIVIDNPENKDEIIKISYTLEGLYDNMNEVICYNTLLDMEYDGEISKDDLKMFADAKLLNNDPMIIVETAYTTYRDCKEFENWLETNRDDYRDMKKADLWAVFISTDEVLRSDYNRIQKILRKFIPSDATLTLEPDNYGIWYEANRPRLILYDMGSIVPIIGHEKPRCPNCGGDLTYVDVELKGKLSLTAAETLEGIYGCATPGCTYEKTNVRKLSRGVGKVRDSRIYAEYCDRNQRSLDDIYAKECNFFLPEYRIYSYEKFVREFENTLRTKKKESEYIIMYHNYLCYEIGGVYQGLGGDLEDLKDDAKTKEMSYGKFCDEFDDLIEDVLDVDRTKITNLAGAVAFIDAIAKNDSITIQKILNARDKMEFEDLVLDNSSFKLSYDEIDQLWDTLEPML